MKKALIIVDLQPDFCEGGALPVEGGNAVAELIATHAKVSNYDFIVTTQDSHIDPGDHFSEDPDYDQSWPPHCIQGTPGFELHPALNPIFQKIDEKFFKGSYDAAYSGFEGNSQSNVSLRDWLKSKNVTNITVVGIATDKCVDATAVDGIKEGFETKVRKDLTAAVDPSSLDALFQNWEELGVKVL